MNAVELARHVDTDDHVGVELMDYAGEWVAVRDHAVFQHAATLDQLFELIQGYEREVEVLRVPEQPGAACFF